MGYRVKSLLHCEPHPTDPNKIVEYEATTHGGEGKIFTTLTRATVDKEPNELGARMIVFGMYSDTARLGLHRQARVTAKDVLAVHQLHAGDAEAVIRAVAGIAERNGILAPRLDPEHVRRVVLGKTLADLRKE